MRGNETPGRIVTNFCTGIGVHDVITSANFYNWSLMGFERGGGSNCGFLHWLALSPLQHFALPCECVIHKFFWVDLGLFCILSCKNLIPRHTSQHCRPTLTARLSRQPRSRKIFDEKALHCNAFSFDGRQCWPCVAGADDIGRQSWLFIFFFLLFVFLPFSQESCGILSWFAHLSLGSCYPVTGPTWSIFSMLARVSPALL